MAAEFRSLFEIGPEIGQGCFGNVYKVKCKKDDQTYALKVMDLSSNNVEIGDVMKEVYVMMTLDHPNILKLIKTHQANSKIGNRLTVGVQLEYCSRGDLSAFLQRRLGKPVRFQRLHTWMLQLSTAVAYIHEKQILHRDLKPENILLDDQKNLKLCDFGIAKVLLNKQAKTRVGTPLFMAPEAFIGAYGLEADVYSMGCVFLCIATGNILPKSANGEIHPLAPETYGQPICYIIHLCMEKSVWKRPTGKEVEDFLRVPGNTSSTLNKKYSFVSEDKDYKKTSLNCSLLDTNSVQDNVDEVDKSAQVPSSDPNAQVIIKKPAAKVFRERIFVPVKRPVIARKREISQSSVASSKCESLIDKHESDKNSTGYSSSSTLELEDQNKEQVVMGEDPLISLVNASNLNGKCDINLEPLNSSNHSCFTADQENLINVNPILVISENGEKGFVGSCLSKPEVNNKNNLVAKVFRNKIAVPVRRPAKSGEKSNFQGSTSVNQISIAEKEDTSISNEPLLESNLRVAFTSLKKMTAHSSGAPTKTLVNKNLNPTFQESENKVKGVKKNQEKSPRGISDVKIHQKVEVQYFKKKSIIRTSKITRCNSESTVSNKLHVQTGFKNHAKEERIAFVARNTKASDASVKVRCSPQLVRRLHPEQNRLLVSTNKSVTPTKATNLKELESKWRSHFSANTPKLERSISSDPSLKPTRRSAASHHNRLSDSNNAGTSPDKIRDSKDLNPKANFRSLANTPKLERRNPSVRLPISMSRNAPLEQNNISDSKYLRSAAGKTINHKEPNCKAHPVFLPSPQIARREFSPEKSANLERSLSKPIDNNRNKNSAHLTPKPQKQQVSQPAMRQEKMSYVPSISSWTRSGAIAKSSKSKDGNNPKGKNGAKVITNDESREINSNWPPAPSFRKLLDSLKFHFHNVHGNALTLTNENRRVFRVTEEESILDGLLFSHRPVKPKEKIHFEVRETYATFDLVIGFTTIDPKTLEGQLPYSIHKLQELGTQGETSCVVLPLKERKEKDFSFYYDSTGDILAEVGKEPATTGRFLNTQKPQWAVLDIRSGIKCLQLFGE